MANNTVSQDISDNIQHITQQSIVPSLEEEANGESNGETSASVDKTRLVTRKVTQPARTSSPPLQSGTLLKDRYLVENLIDSGGISHIYRARDTFLEQANIKDAFVAVKVLQKQFVDQPEALQLLLQEARKTQQLAHPNIIRLFDVNADSNNYYLVMEYLDGETLEQVINRYKPKGLPFKSAHNLLKQISDGLEYAHQQGIVHADLKPANVMVDRHGHVKLLDFGVAQKLQQNIDIYAAEQSAESTPINGYTPAYASPELLAGNAPSPSDDVYSFACLTYELLTSKHPFNRTPADRVQREQLKANKPSHVNLLQWLAIKQGLNLNEKQRTSSVKVFMNRLCRPTLPTFIATAALVLLFLGSVFFYQTQQSKIQYLQQALGVHKETENYHANLVKLDPTDVLNELDKLTEQNPIIASGLLSFHTASMVSFFEKKIDALLSDRSQRYPDYQAIEEISAQAAHLYPDSHQLAGVRNRIARSKQSSLEVLQNQLNSLLFAQNYQNSDNLNPYQVLTDLQRIDPSFQPQPHEEAVTIFVQEFDLALQKHDAARLQELLAIGQAAFSNSTEAQPLLEDGSRMQSAIDAMANYQRQLENGTDTGFPHPAAEVFYQFIFNDLSVQLEQSTSPAEVDAIYEQWQEYADLWPNDFEFNIRLQRQLADRYLAIAGELLKTNQVRNAERLMRRANELMVNVSG